MLMLKLRDWKPDAVIKQHVPDAASLDALEMMLLHWIRCLPEFHGLTPPEAVTLDVAVDVRVMVEVPWCPDVPQQFDLGETQQASDG